MPVKLLAAGQNHPRRPPRQVLSELRALLPSFVNNEKERSVVKFLLSRPSEIGALTISEIAAHLAVSESTIVKVCKKLGFAGFKELRRAFATFTPERSDYLSDEIDPDDDDAAICAKVFDTAINTFQDTHAILDLDALGAAVAILREAGRIACYGIGGSGPLALDAHHKLLLTGFGTDVYTDSHLIAMSASLLKPDDAIIVYSFSGETSALNKTVTLAKKRGAKAIGITCHRNTTLTRLADVVLYAALREHPLTGENSSVRLAQKVVFDCLLACAVKDQREKVEDAFTRATEAVREI